MSKRAALYIRVSSDEQAKHGLSLGEQRADLLKYAETHGYAVVDIYADEGTTARKAIKQRKELQRLLADVEAGRIDVIVIKCLDRWSRNIADFYETQKFLDEHEVTWECTQEKYNTSTASGRLYMNIRMSIAQDESDRTSERIKYVFEGKKARKEVISGNVAFGYSIVDKHAVPNDDAPIVQFMFEQMASGSSARSLTRSVLEKFGVKIQYCTIYDLLRNRSYIGEMYGIPDYCEPIIPYDIFQTVQGMVRKNRRAASSGRIYLFTGLIVCPYCGSKLFACAGRKNVKGEFYDYRYKCRIHSSQPQLELCSFTRAISENKTEQYLLNNIQNLLAQHIYDVELLRAKQRKDNPEAKLEEIKNKLSRLKDIYLDGMIEKSEYEKDYVALRQKAAELTVRIEKVPSIRSSAWEMVNSENFHDTYNSLTRENKRRFWHSFIADMTFEDTPESRGYGGKFSFKVNFL